MNIIYYIEVNLICIIVLLIFQHQFGEKRADNATPQVIFNGILWANVIFCICDMLAGILRGQFFPGARILIEISNLLYFEALAGIAFLWFLYVIVKLDILTVVRRSTMLMMGIPFFLFTVIAVIDPVTHFLFTIDENNLYTRNIGVYLHWIITWGYLIASTVITVKKLKRTKNKQERVAIVPMLYFIVAPAIASALQMVCYGVTSTQVGITVSLVLIFINEQHNQVLMDSLTGLNNRKGLYYFFNEHILGQKGVNVSLMMLDLNEFKSINDTYGHMVGDQALVVASRAIRQACIQVEGTYLLCRYGGDEFVIAAIDSSEEKDTRVIEAMTQILDLNNKLNNTYILDFSVGYASACCANTDEFEQLLKEADAAMYANKQQHKKQGNHR